MLLRSFHEPSTITRRRHRSEDPELDSLIPFQFGPGFMNYGASKDINLDFKETDTHYELLADFPGVPKEEIKVEVKNHVLTVSQSSDSTKETSKENETYHFSERVHRYSSRSIRLPRDANEDETTASYENGVLKIRFTKKVPDDAKVVAIN
jgi:HSP20 family protein